MSGRTHRIERSQVVPRPLHEVFEFFSDPGNLARLTPPSMRFRILTPLPIAMRPGAEIDFEVHVLGIPQRWRSRIDVFDPDRRFVDVQVKGPYATWNHVHEFAEADGGTRITDKVEYRLPLGIFGALAHGVFVRKMLDDLFEFRHRAIAEILGAPPPR